MEEGDLRQAEEGVASARLRHSGVMMTFLCSLEDGTHHRLDAVGDALADELVVVADAVRVDLVDGARRKQARPRQREAVQLGLLREQREAGIPERNVESTSN